jgi:fumarate hydratase class II
VSDEQLWGAETEHAIRNFRVSGEPMHPAVIAWVARIKSAAAAANAQLGLLDVDVAARIGEAADAIAAGAHAAQFPVDVFQTGSATSTNMNVNEVIATLTGGLAHPNDHVNMGQSSNDVMPTAVQLAACELITGDLVPALEATIDRCRRLATETGDVVKPGRTHLMDAVPVVLGDEFESYAAQLEECVEQLTAARRHLARLPLGGTAVGNGLGAHPELASRVVERLTTTVRLGVELELPVSRLARQGAHDALVAASGATNVVAVALTKIANDLRWMSSGPNTGLAEIALPALQKGSSIMPGKVNPVVPEVVLQVAAQVIGNHTAVTVAGMQGNFELNVMLPVMARNLLGSIGLLAAACRSLTDDCLAGVRVDAERTRDLAGRSLPLATALNTALGYDTVEQIVRTAAADGTSVREAALSLGVPGETLDAELDLDRIARGPRTR